MKFLTALTSALLLVTPALAAPLDERQTVTDFSLRVWKAFRMDPAPFVGHLDIEANGNAIFNRTQTPKEYRYALNAPTPLGPGSLYQRGTGKLAYLSPVANTEGHYKLKFAKTIPDTESCVLSEDWARQGRGCGGNCGGVELRYQVTEDPNAIRSDTFYIFPHSSIPYAYEIRYAWNATAWPVPNKGVPFIMYN